MKANTIYLGAIILSIMFIAILALCLVFIKPESKYKSDRKDTDIAKTSHIPLQENKERDNQQNKYDSNEYNDDSPPNGQRDDSNNYFEPNLKPKPSDIPKSKPKLTASFSENCVVYHNKYRSQHRQTNAVSFSQKLTTSAKRKAEIMAKTDDFSHTQDLDDGENLWYFMISRGSAQMFQSMDCYKSSKGWYDEIRHYNYRFPTQSSGVVGHFTQMVWRSTRQMGCAKSHSSRSNRIYVVCHYNPAGNFVGRYTQNVFPKIY